MEEKSMWELFVNLLKMIFDTAGSKVPATPAGSGSMLLFVAIAIAGMILLVGGSIFGHDHDHDFGHDFDHDHDHDHGADGHGNEPTVSIFSMKVIATFIMGFGAGGAIASYYKADVVIASLSGLGTGVLLGAAMYGMMLYIYGQQSNSLVSTETTIGQRATVVVPISPDSYGEIGLTHMGQYRIYIANSVSGNKIPKGRQVEVVETHGSQVTVREIQ